MEHENVIQLYETFESTKYIHLLLPYLEGGELFEKIRNKGLYRESDARPVMRNFLSALEYIHSKLIVHRDLKLENLILASKKNNWDLKIVDFGLATTLESPDEKLFLRCGSPGYIAPEVL
jgi:calcium/calmodulin-dependent protein kinase I